MVRIGLIFFSKTVDAYFLDKFPEASAWAVASRSIGQLLDHCLIFLNEW